MCISDGLLVMLVCAVLLGGLRTHYNSYRGEEIALAQLCQTAKLLNTHVSDTFWTWDGPTWIENALTLEGRQKLRPLFLRIEGVGFRGKQLSDKELAKLIPLLRPFKALRFVYLEESTVTQAGEQELHRQFPGIEVRTVNQ